MMKQKAKKKLEEEWDKFTKGIKFELVSQYILIGQEGAVLQVETKGCHE